MAGHWTDKFSFIRGAIRSRDILYVVMSDDEMASEKIPHSFLVLLSSNKWYTGGDTDWLTAGLGILRKPEEHSSAIGEFGRALLLGSGDRHEEVIASGANSPEDRGPLRGVRAIGAH